MATQTVNEKSPLYMTMKFEDENGADIVPTTVEWRLDDMEEDPPAEIVAWTSIPAPAATMNVTIPGSDNLISDTTKSREEQMFGIRIDDGMDTEGYQQFQYNVLNLVGPSGS